jgi:hypothetical protein
VPLELSRPGVDEGLKEEDEATYAASPRAIWITAMAMDVYGVPGDSTLGHASVKPCRSSFIAWALTDTNEQLQSNELGGAGVGCFDTGGPPTYSSG